MFRAAINSFVQSSALMGQDATNVPEYALTVRLPSPPPPPLGGLLLLPVVRVTDAAAPAAAAAAFEDHHQQKPTKALIKTFLSICMRWLTGTTCFVGR